MVVLPPHAIGNRRGPMGLFPRANGFRAGTEGDRSRTEGHRSRKESLFPPTEGLCAGTERHRSRKESLFLPTEGLCARTEGDRSRTERHRSRKESLFPRTEGLCPGKERHRSRKESLFLRTEGLCARTDGLCAGKESFCARSKGSCNHPTPFWKSVWATGPGAHRARAAVAGASVPRTMRPDPVSAFGPKGIWSTATRSAPGAEDGAGSARHAVFGVAPAAANSA